MVIILKFFLFSAMLLHLLSCTPGAPYEIKSPCVSTESDDISNDINPCVRRSINSQFGIT
jgi:hypothetical protein